MASKKKSEKSVIILLCIAILFSSISLIIGLSEGGEAVGEDMDFESSNSGDVRFSVVENPKEINDSNKSGNDSLNEKE